MHGQVLSEREQVEGEGTGNLKVLTHHCTLAGTPEEHRRKNRQHSGNNVLEVKIHVMAVIGDFFPPIYSMYI